MSLSRESFAGAIPVYKSIIFVAAARALDPILTHQTAVHFYTDVLNLNYRVYKKLNNSAIVTFLNIYYITLGDELDNTASSLDLVLGELRDESGTNNDGNLRKRTLAKNLSIAMGKSVDDRSSGVRGRREVLLTGLLRDKSPQLIKVQNWAPELVALQVEVSHTDLTEVTRVVLVKVSSVVVLTTSHTPTTGVLSVLANTTVTGCC
jgi:hypothetical protein